MDNPRQPQDSAPEQRSDTDAAVNMTVGIVGLAAVIAICPLFAPILFAAGAMEVADKARESKSRPQS